MKKKVAIFEYYTGEVVHFARNEEIAETWIYNEALTYNFGRFRYWEEKDKGWRVFDIGPKVYAIKSKNFKL